MKIAPVSGDLLVKLTLIAAAVGLVAYGVKEVNDKLSKLKNPLAGMSDVLYQTMDAIGNAWTSGAINPASTENVIYSGVNDSLFPAGTNTVGGWLYDLIHSDPVNPNSYANALSAWDTAGRWNNPSAYTAPAEQGGAAFGIYPKAF